MIQCRLVTIVWILYTYDASGNRISKLVIPPSGGQGVTTWYTRDAQGNVMSVYETGKTSLNDGRLTQTELHLYGSSRLGLLRRSLIVEDSVLTTPDPYKITMPIFGVGDSIPFVRGNKLFELSNHLGNVLVTVNDKKLGVSSNNSTIDYFNPQIVSAQDYYPFGMLQPGRVINTSGYRYGFNGKENDNEVKGEGSQQDYGMRVYDPRIGRFLSTDPLKKDYPELTPYQFASNRPIDGVDLDGEEFYKKNISYDVRTGKFSITVGYKVNVSSSAKHVCVDVPQMANLFNDKFNAAFEGVNDRRRGISYSAEGEVTINQENAPVNIVVNEVPPQFFNSRTRKRLYATGTNQGVNTLKNTIFSAVAMMDETGKSVVQVMSDEYVALTAAHEVLHTGAVSHPFDDENIAEDVDLEQANPVNGKIRNWQPAIGADVRMIRTNIMMYTSTSVNGSRITDATKLNKISPDQALVFIKTITNQSGEQYEKDKTKTP